MTGRPKFRHGIGVNTPLVVCAVVAVVWFCAGWMVHEHSTNAVLRSLHQRYVQTCVMGTDESAEECEKRWEKALER